MHLHAQLIAQPPLSPADMSLVHRAFSRSIETIGLSGSDPEAARLAALAIHLYQSGLRDESLLRRAILGASSD